MYSQLVRRALVMCKGRMGDLEEREAVLDVSWSCILPFLLYSIAVKTGEGPLLNPILNMSSVVNEKYHFWHLQQRCTPDGEPEAK